MSFVYRNEVGRTVIDCPVPVEQTIRDDGTCGQQTVCERNGRGYRFRCFGGHDDDEIVPLLDPVVMLELGRAENAAVTGGDKSAAAAVTGDDAVTAVRRALLEDPADLGEALRGDRPAREMVPGSGGLIARGIAHTVFSARGCGKSLIMAVLGASMAHADERVLMLDRENGDAVAAERFSCIFDANPEWERVVDDGKLVGKHYPTLDPKWDGADVAIALDAFTVVLLDSTREFLGQLGGGNNDDDAVTLLWNTIVTPLLRDNVAVVLADNTGHQNPGRPKGAGGKMDAAPQIYQVEPISEFNPTLTGEVRLTCTRSRFGDIDRSWTARLGDGVYEVPSSDSQAPDEERYRLARARREAFQAAAARLIEAATEPLSANRLLDELRDRGAGVRRAKGLAWIRDLADDPGSRVVVDENGLYKPKNGPHPGGSRPRVPIGTRPGTGTGEPPGKSEEDS